MVRTASLLTLLALVGACASAPSAESERRRTITAMSRDLILETRGALDEQVTMCVATALVDELGIERFEDVESVRDLPQRALDILDACDALGALLVPSPSPAGS